MIGAHATGLVTINECRIPDESRRKRSIIWLVPSEMKEISMNHTSSRNSDTGRVKSSYQY